MISVLLRFPTRELPKGIIPFSDITWSKNYNSLLKKFDISRETFRPNFTYLLVELNVPYAH